MKTDTLNSVVDRQKVLLAHDYKVIKGMTSEYIELHLFNLHTDSYTPYYIENENDRAAMPIMSMFPDFCTAFREFVELECHPDDKEEMLKSTQKDYIRQKLQHKKRYSVNFRMKSPSGTYRWYVYVFIKFEDTTQEPVEIAAGYIDIDEEQQLKEIRQHELEEIKMAKQAAAMKAHFVENISHEIRTPLNAISGFSTLLCDQSIELSDEEKKEFQQVIAQNTELLLMLVDDVLESANIENGNLRIILSSVNCNAICQQAIKNVEHRVPQNVSLTFTTEIANHIEITSDSRRLLQILLNLLTNSCKHTQKGEIHLHVSDTEVEGMVTFSVTDTGSGIPASQAEAIFERFTKLDDFVQGTGLGLSICRELTTRLGGTILLDTSYTDGARFTLSLPK